MFRAGLGLLLAAASLEAHHSFAADYDVSRPTVWTGVVTRIAWTNPHARLYVDVKDAGGQAAVWEFELSSPNALVRRGWTRTSLKPGDTIKVAGYPSKAGDHTGVAYTVTTSEGHRLFGRYRQ